MRESDIQKAVVKWLDLEAATLLWFAVPNEGKHHVAYRKHQRAMGVTPGVADLVFIGGGGKAHFIEMKAAKGSLSASQRIFRDCCKQIGAPWALCRSLEEVQGTLRGWLLVR